MVTQPLSDWVLLSYRVPREPSTPRIAVWRKLKELGVAQIGDGLVALPADPRTREHLEWVANSVIEADGEAIVWLASPSRRLAGQDLIAVLNRARDAEYSHLVDEVSQAGGPERASRRTVDRWRRKWNKIDKRDYFDAPLREVARTAIAEFVSAPVEQRR